MEKSGAAKKYVDKDTKNDTFSSDNKTNSHGYIGFNGRLVLYILLFGLCLTICLLLATKTTERKILDPIKYSQKGNIEYKVYLNKNDFYSEEYLGMNRAYIASLINYIDVDFSYLFVIEKDTKMDFEYKIIGELVIENNNGSARYLEKEYILSDLKKRNINDTKALTINENLKIDYAYYNQLANSFKSTYGVDINSYLNVYLEVNGFSDESLNYKINETNRMALRIPLSEKAIEINLNASNLDVNKQVFPLGQVVFNILPLIGEIIFFIPTCILLIIVIKYIALLMKTETPYDKYVNKLLKEYDRLIVETHTVINLDKYNVIRVKSFNELLDVRDNLKLPILYLNINKHQKGIFYILNNQDVYMLKIKNVDLKSNS